MVVDVIDTAGTTATTEITNVKDVTISDERATADTSTRASGFETAKGTTRKVSIEFSMLWDEEEEGFAAVLDAYTTQTAVAIKAISKTSGTGIDADCYIMKLTRSEGLKDGVIAEVTAKPTYLTRYPQSV